MSSLKVDIDHMNELGRTLNRLATEAAALRTQRATATLTNMKSVSEASSIDDAIVLGALIPTIEERLSETGEVMVAAANQYSHRDGATSQMIADTFSAATGDWKAGADR